MQAMAERLSPLEALEAMLQPLQSSAVFQRCPHLLQVQRDAGSLDLSMQLYIRSTPLHLLARSQDALQQQDLWIAKAGDRGLLAGETHA